MEIRNNSKRQPRLRSIVQNAALLSICAVAPASGQQSATEPTAQTPTRQSSYDTTNPGASTMDQLSLAEPEPGQPILPPDKQPEKKNPFFTDAKVAAQLRTYYFYKDAFDSTLSEAWAVGGSVSIKSGYLGDRFAIGAVGYMSEPIYAPDDRGGTGLLEPEQEGFIVLGQIYGELKIVDKIFAAVGRKEYNTPYVNKNDTRMVPNTFEGASIYGKAGGGEGEPAWRFGAGYLSKIKERNTEDFVWMSHDAGSTAERGVVLGGANVDWKGLSFGAIDYYCDDVINIFYTEASYKLLKGDGYDLKIAGQYTDQRSVGDDRLTGDDFSTWQLGFKADLTVGPAVFTAAITTVNDGDTMRSPWSGYPGYTSVQVQDFFRAGESAAMFRAGYDFTSLGLKGVSAYALYVYGFGVEDPNSDQSEIDLNLQWTPVGGALRGMSYRLRYAYVTQRGDGDPDINEFRFILNYDFPRPD